MEKLEAYVDRAICLLDCGSCGSCASWQRCRSYVSAGSIFETSKSS